VRERLMATGADLVGSTPETLAAFIQTEIAKWSRMVKFADARID
jgi:tripartite-type tricarboxylate transporter receptor subunit TctC